MHIYSFPASPAAVAVLLLLVSACSDSTTPEPQPAPKIASVSLSTAQSALDIGDTIRLAAHAQLADGSSAPDAIFSWRSLHPDIATVSADGVVEGKQHGADTIVVTVAGPAASIDGTISAAFALEVRSLVKRVVVTAADTIVTGDTVPVHATAYDATGAPMPGVTFTWSSSDTLVAAVDSSASLVGRGIGTTTITAKAMGPSDAVPVARSGDGAVSVRLVLTQISGGARHNCGIARGGAVHCWGEGAWGRLGTGISYDAWTPIRTPVPALTGPHFTAATGDFENESRSGHTCALSTDGAVYCWGSDAWGMLGDGRHGESIPPMANPVPTRVDGVPLAKQVVLGAKHTCILAQDGTTWCAGSNLWTELGIATAPDNCPSYGYDEPCALHFTKASGDHLFTQIVAGDFHTCGLTDTGEAWCWGMGGFGQLGTGDSTLGDKNPTPLQVAGGLQFRSLAAGGLHTCGLVADGTLYCWGDNWYGTLGTGESERAGRKYAPTPVLTSLRFASVYAGQTHTCALTDDGTAYCWGQNDAGQLGATTTTTCGGTESSAIYPCSTTPVAVQTSLRFTMLGLGFAHSCGLTADGTAYCWGLNTGGQLGTGTSSNAQSPTKVVDVK